ncbi:hypothetical protein TMatcc_008367 [Talaromyces marneffei ATCC 18224]
MVKMGQGSEGKFLTTKQGWNRARGRSSDVLVSICPAGVAIVVVWSSAAGGSQGRDYLLVSIGAGPPPRQDEAVATDPSFGKAGNGPDLCGEPEPLEQSCRRPGALAETR